MNQTHKTVAIFVAFATIAILIGCAKKPGMDMTLEENKALLQRYLNEMNMANESYLDEYFAAEYVYHGPAGELDAQGFKAMHSMFLSAFPDAQIKC